MRRKINVTASEMMELRNLYDLTQLLAWLMRERVLKTEGVADAE